MNAQSEVPNEWFNHRVNALVNIMYSWKPVSDSTSVAMDIFGDTAGMQF